MGEMGFQAGSKYRYEFGSRCRFAMRVPGAEVGHVDHADQAWVVDHEAARDPVSLCLGLAGEGQNEDDGRNEQKDAVRDPDPCN